MADIEHVTQLFEQSKSCSSGQFIDQFEIAFDLFRYLPNDEKKECASGFYIWAKNQKETEPLKFYYAQFLMGIYHHLNDEHEIALQYFIDSKKNFDSINDQNGIGMCLILIGSIYRTFGNFDLALKTIWDGYGRLLETHKFLFGHTASTNAIANIQFEMAKYDEALEMFHTTYDIAKKNHDNYFTIYALHGLGKTNLKLNHPELAKEFIEESLELAKRIQNFMQTANSISELANFYFHINDLNEAEKLNKESLEMREAKHLYGGAITNCIHLAEIYIKQKQWENAKQILKKGMELAERIKVKPKIFQIHYLLSEIFQNENQFEKSLYHFKQFQKVHEEVQKEDNARKLSDAKLIFEAEQTKRENKIIRDQKAIIEKKNIELQDTIDELTLAKVNRKAKALTFSLAVVLFIFEDRILGFALEFFSGDNYFISLIIKLAIIFSLNPINRTIEHFLLKKVVKKKKMESEMLAS